MKYCSKCGKELEDDAAFCPACGNPTNSESGISTTPLINQGLVTTKSSSSAGLVLGIVGLGLSVLAFFIFGWLGFVAVILGIVGVVQSSKNVNPSGMRTAGMVTSVLSIIFGSVDAVMWLILVMRMAQQ